MEETIINSTNTHGALLPNYKNLDTKVEKLKSILKELDIEDSVEIQITTLIHPISLKDENINLSNNLHRDLKRIKEEKEGKGFLTINL